MTEPARRHLFAKRVDGVFTTFCGLSISEPPQFDERRRTETCGLCLRAVNGPTTRKGASR